MSMLLLLGGSGGGGGGGGGPASVANSRKALASSVNTASTASFTSTAGNTIWVSVSDAGGQGAVTISDNKGNTYTQIGTTQTTALGGSQLRRFYCQNITGGAGHIVTATWATNADAVVCVEELAGVATTGVLDGSNQTDKGSPPWTVTSPTPSQADTIALSAISSSWSGTWAESTGFTVDQQEGNNGLYWTSAAASKVLTTAAAVTPSWTITGGGSGAALSVDIFKAAPSGGGGAAALEAAAAAVATSTAALTSGIPLAAGAAAVATATAALTTASPSLSADAAAQATATAALSTAIRLAASPTAVAAASASLTVQTRFAAAAQAVATASGTLTSTGGGAAALEAAAVAQASASASLTGGTVPAAGGGMGFEMGGGQRRIPERNFKPLLQRVLEARYPRVKPAKERAAKRAKAIEVKAAELIADDGMAQVRFDALMAEWLAEKPVAAPSIDLRALFEAQVGFRLRQLALEAQARQALAEQRARDEEDSLIALLLA